MSKAMITDKLCPQCGGIFFAGSSLKYEHRDLECSMRYVSGDWIPPAFEEDSILHEAILVNEAEEEREEERIDKYLGRVGH